MVSMPPTNARTKSGKGDGALDARREASMADEGGWSAALVETEEPVECPEGAAPPANGMPAEPFPPRGGARRFLGSVAQGAAIVLAKLVARARRYAARRAHARANGH